jgi:hypothetical protein
MIRGYGLKIEGDAEHVEDVEFFFENDTEPTLKADVVAVNEPKTIKVVVPAQLGAGRSYSLRIVTQSSPKNSGYTLKALREIRSDFKLKVFKRETPSTGEEPSA